LLPQSGARRRNLKVDSGESMKMPPAYGKFSNA
jgi:hypothetical protein